MTSSSPTLYLIRHGEKDEDPVTGEDGIGLSATGLNRAQQLVQVFGRSSPYDIGCILAQHPKKDGHRIRPYDTVKPLHKALPGVPFNHEIDRDDISGVAAFVKDYVSNSQSKGNLLICWEHKQLNDIAGAIIRADNIGSGDANTPLPEYPGDRFDIIWTMNAPYNKIDDETSEHCKPLDDKYAAEGGYNYPPDSNA